jgi:flagellar biosynthetic protein FlhB
MAEDQGDKTEAPTPRRRTEAREQGNVARSQDLTLAALLIGIMLMLNATGPKLVTALRGLVHEMLGGPSLSDFSSAGATDGALRAITVVGWAMAPLLAGVVIIALVANIVQVGFHLSPKRLQPNLAALNPVKGWGRIFGSRNPTQFGINVVKMVLLTAVAYSAVHSRLGQIMAVQQLSFIQIFGLGAQIVYSIALRVGVAMLILAILDYAYQKWRVEQELKMTKQEGPQDQAAPPANRPSIAQAAIEKRRAHRRRRGDQPDGICGRAQV